MISLSQTQPLGAPPRAPRSERTDLLTVACRMFNEGFKKSTILRITGLDEEEFLSMIRDLHRARPTLA